MLRPQLFLALFRNSVSRPPPLPPKYYYRLTGTRSSRCAADMSKYSKACCSIPPVVSKGYEEKGKYVTINGMKTYVTGPENATEAILVIYDIFGFFPQTVQGADIMATSDPNRNYRVFIPDFFDGNPADIAWYPPTTEEHKKNLGHFFQTKAVPSTTLSRIPRVVEEANKLAEGGKFKAWAILGYCWGGKIATLASMEDTLFKAAVQCHPAMVDAKDALKVTIPMVLLASKDEDANEVKAFENNLKPPHHIETWSTQIHGWMAARGDLEDPEVRKEYENGYKTVLGFLNEHM
ncbi:carboxymethylenebutenolidase [[Emmonsia] crescens]|uniref:Carboxymethylenebutenolidase n=1 Tax=[Emmonsia] crescens TaxID=73230 RepID=A0A0G2J6C9_9EURO|nr:carboxymethylenebutenolidase [Emmonsia crescens UAMH 3008]